MTISYGSNPVAEAVSQVLERLAAGEWNADETALVDLKEEADRRDRQGAVLPGSTRSESVAEQVAGESACMANTPGGGALILGVADDGTLIGTALDVDWLRHRVYELTDRALTIDVRPVTINDVRLLVITSLEAIEPIRWRGRVTWRVDDHCVEVDPATWHARRMIRTRFDWSAQDSQVPSDAAREASVDIARSFLRASGEAHAIELAGQRTAELLRRLNVVGSDGFLTNVGVIAFVGRGDPALDYIRREVTGGDSQQRVHAGGRGALEELQEVLVNVAAHNPTVHLRRGLVSGQVKELPEQAVREAIVNGLAHREWGLAQPTTIEHIGRTLRITSPGGFFGGVNPANIITHPSQSRNRALTELFAAVRVAEREGVGVDRMVREMLRFGHRPPDIAELDGPYVRTSLVGDAADTAWIEWLAEIEPSDCRDDLNALLLLRRLVDEAWVDVSRARPLLQLNGAEAEGALQRLSRATSGGRSLLVPIRGVPDDQEPSWALSPTARHRLIEQDRLIGRSRSWPTRGKIAQTYARDRGRISTTELASIVGASATNVGSVLKELEEAGVLAPSRASRRGPGLFYAYTGTGA